MADVAIVAAEVANAPQDYKLPGAQEILLKAVGCTINGSAASGSFVPALQMIDPAGHVMWTAVNESSPVAVGRSALVSWFPGGGIDSAGSSSSTEGILSLTSPLATLSVGNTKGPAATIDMPTSGVSAGSYGDSGHVGTFTVDAEGRLITAASVSIAGGGAVAGADGWVADTNGYTFASASSFTVGASDLTAVYSPGTRIKLTQTTLKYFVVTSSSFGAGATTVNITAGSDFTLANAAISLPFYSYVANPQGYPGWFNYTPVWTGCSANPGGTARFAVVGRTCSVVVSPTSNGTSNSTTKSVTAPIAISSSAPQFTDTWGAAHDNGADLTSPGHNYFGTLGSAVITNAKDGTGTNWTASGTWLVRFVMTYNI